MFPSGINVSNKVNVKDLKLAEGLDDCPPPPVHVGLDGTLWAVESILNSKTTKKDGTFLLVHWTGLNGPNDNTWEPLRNLLHLPILLEGYFGAGKVPKK